MNTRERLDMSHELMRQARLHMSAGETAADPVWERRNLARGAAKLRAAADHLDDQGRLDPDWQAGSSP